MIKNTWEDEALERIARHTHTRDRILLEIMVEYRKHLLASAQALSSLNENVVSLNKYLGNVKK